MTMIPGNLPPDAQEMHDQIIQRLEALREDYMRHAQPYFDQLAKIEEMRSPPILILDQRELDALGVLNHPWASLRAAFGEEDAS